MSIALFDLDRFKSVNDTYGHAVGDEVLNGISRILGFIPTLATDLFEPGRDPAPGCGV